MNQAGERISGLGDKVENLDKISKEKWDCLSSTGWKHAGNVGYHQIPNLWIKVRKEVKESQEMA